MSCGQCSGKRDLGGEGVCAHGRAVMRSGMADALCLDSAPAFAETLDPQVNELST